MVDERASWWNGSEWNHKLSKWHDGDMVSWWNVILTKLQVDKIWGLILEVGQKALK